MITSNGAPPSDPAITLDALNRAGPPDAAAELMACCASRRWVSEMVGHRPYRTFDAMIVASDDTLAALPWADVLEALAAHPRIGERSTGASTEATWSRQEQAATADLSNGTAERLIAVNRAYEAKFGHVFLICATGMPAEQMIEAAGARLTNEPLVERATVVEELRKIVRLRLGKAFR